MADKIADEDKPKEEVVDEEKQKDEVIDEEELKAELEQPELEEKPEEETEQTEEAEQAEEEAEEPLIPPRWRRFVTRVWAKYKAKKKVTIPLTIGLLLVVLLAVPTTRFSALGLFLKHDVDVSVFDSKANIPVSGVEVTLRGQTVKTDGEGKATLKSVKVGKANLTVQKKHYKDVNQNVLVDVGKSKEPVKVSIEATGRQVPVHLVNKITGKNVAGATIKVSDTEAETDQNGETTLVLPADRTEEKGTITADGYNNQSVKVKVDGGVKDNTFTLTPSGKIYFLSKLSGKIDVVKTDLDGANRQTVLAGTGSEEETNTILLATRDWKYLALHSKREGDKARIYLIETENDKLTEIDSGDATFSITGWQDQFFVYKVNRNAPIWKGKHQALKSYNAETKTLTTIDETDAEGTSTDDHVSNSINNIYLIKDDIIYTKTWSSGYYSAYRLVGKRSGFYSAKQNGSSKQTVNDFDAPRYVYINAVASEPGEIYYSVYNQDNQKNNYFEYNDGKITEITDENETKDWFNKPYPTYLQSPSGQKTFWFEPRDGKNTLLIGTADGTNGKDTVSLSEHIPYGWYTEDYLLVSKNNSELYILSSGERDTRDQTLKITDYHKPAFTFRGYGGGYGGL